MGDRYCWPAHLLRVGHQMDLLAMAVGRTVKRQVVGMLLQQLIMGTNEFTGIMLERVDYRHPLSGLRRLRELRQAGLVNYEVVNASKSKYRILSTLDQLAESLRKLASKE